MRSAPGWMLWGALALTSSCGTSQSIDAAVPEDAALFRDDSPRVDSGGDAGTVTGDVAVGDAGSDDTSARAVSAAQAFLATLSEPQRVSVSFAYDDAAQRTRWSNLPTGIFARAGLKLGVLSEPQQSALFALLGVILSERGYAQVLATVQADEVLRSTSGGGMLVFGRAEYFVLLRGTPSLTRPWALQFGGHHLAINATVVGANITLAPSLTGGQPTSYTADGVSVRTQGDENDQLRAFFDSLSSSQRAEAVRSSSSIDMVLGPGQDGRTITSEGLRASALDAPQRALLLSLIRARVGMLNDEDAAARIAQIESQLDQTWFAWFGPAGQVGRAYYRITAPTLVIEYSPQSMGGDSSNHLHAMYRDPTNDYGVGFTP